MICPFLLKLTLFSSLSHFVLTCAIELFDQNLTSFQLSTSDKLTSHFPFHHLLHTAAGSKWPLPHWSGFNVFMSKSSFSIGILVWRGKQTENKYLIPFDPESPKSVNYQQGSLASVLDAPPWRYPWTGGLCEEIRCRTHLLIKRIIFN